ncbi:MAG: hypothetical protein U0168_27040 [Nannocystaceae bacterium]
MRADSCPRVRPRNVLVATPRVPDEPPGFPTPEPTTPEPAPAETPWVPEPQPDPEGPEFEPDDAPELQLRSRWRRATARRRNADNAAVRPLASRGFGAKVAA